MTPSDKKLERLSQAIIDVSDKISALKREMRAK